MALLGKRSFPSLLRAFRESRDKSTFDLAKELNTTEDLVKRVEAGAIDMPEYLFGRWAEALDSSITGEGLIWLYMQFKARSIALKSGVPVMFDIQPLTNEKEITNYIQKISNLMQEIPIEEPGGKSGIRIKGVHNEYRFITKRNVQSDDGEESGGVPSAT